ncbi:SusD/RagB family nutrient-binding outer membrane lipoprotein [Fodinibius saliphilus]|uniref:SusD/RagB family nutrient-binding outer membrane lipoprotein n=1 Tax=Fodinibius saliphilus TaxID=1920650 RepID=UPI00110882AA|nr:SusD/RagB family nutrient-binding outer membrane lipoprotein [Fodinibius saliphilus]
MRLYKSIIILVLLTGFIGCEAVNTSFTDGYNEDPNNPTDAKPEKTFIAGQTAAIEFLEGEAAQVAAMWTRQATGSDRQFSGFHSYGYTSGDSGGAWFLAYTRALTNQRITQSKLEGESTAKANSLTAISKINEALVMGTVAALWGDVPYSEAAQIGEPEYSPKYEAQGDVYGSLQSLLDNAISNLNAPLPSEVADAYSYNGDDALWTKAAYTLKARYYMHTGNYSQALAAASNGVTAMDGSEDLMIPHGETYQGNMNYWYSFKVFDRSGYFTAGDNLAFPLMEQRTANDPKTDESGRMAFYYNSAGDDLNISEGGAYYKSASYPLIRASETHLIMAEASARSATSLADQAAVDAIDHLNDARGYNENVFGGTYDDYTAADFADLGELMQEIRDETYLSLMHQIEAFNFTRRVDYGVTNLQPVSGQPEFPERFLYPDSELNANENVPEQDASVLFKATPVNQ